jgi:flagellar protein FliO/FliZ
LDTAFQILRVALSLGVVFGLLWVLHKRLAKGQFGKAQHGRRSASLEVVARKGIGGKSSVVVVDVEGERLVLGVSEHGVNLLTSGTAPAPALEAVAPVVPIAPVAAPVTAPVVVAPAASETASADRFRRALDAQTVAATGLPTDLPLRPRNRSRRAQRAVLPTSAQLQGSILSADTWKQAAAALRSRRAG